jgi:uncharacterized protein (DUF2461 family)
MNYYKLKDEAPSGSVYVKMGKDMVFLAVEDLPQMKKLLSILDEKDEHIAILSKHINELDAAFRKMEQALRQKGVKL